MSFALPFLTTVVHTPWLWVTSLLCLISVAAFWARVKYNSLRPRIKDVTTCGYIAPLPSEAALTSLNRMARAFIAVQVGKIKYIGLENLQNVPGPCIYSANHPHYIDPLIASQTVRKQARYMAHGRVMQSLGGLLGLYLSKRGVFAAHDDIKDGGARTREAAVRMLISGQQLVIFPEGLTNFSPAVDDLRPGTVKIAREAALRLGKPVYIVPGYTRYGRYPGKWLAKFDRPIQYFTVLLGFAFFRRGAVVTVGKPISTNELYGPSLNERTDDEAMALLKQRIESLDPGQM